ncbi:putative phage tail protein [Clostridium tetani]|uniref:putative phage tail protein n=1 Tax=Clostridium tetani TaxID=1513 RepID=UPI0013E92058|nr:putative phage tail protein [Clostridium tetani]
MYIPSFYFNKEQVTDITTSMDIEVKNLKETIEDLLKQLFIDSATWGVTDWEKLYGLKIDNTEALANRRARIKMAMRGQGTVTKAMLKNLCKSFTNGDVEIIENTDYSFIIKFIDIKGVPQNISYLKNAIEEVKPAHLAFSFKYLYNTWVLLKNKTWGEIKTKTWEDIRII